MGAHLQNYLPMRAHAPYLIGLMALRVELFRGHVIRAAQLPQHENTALQWNSNSSNITFSLGITCNSLFRGRVVTPWKHGAILTLHTCAHLPGYLSQLPGAHHFLPGLHSFPGTLHVVSQTFSLQPLYYIWCYSGKQWQPYP